jgi:hypothetical protein
VARRALTEADRLREIRDQHEFECDQGFEKVGHGGPWRRLADAQFEFRLLQLRHPENASNMAWPALRRAIDAMLEARLHGACPVNLGVLIHKVNSETEKAFPTIGPTEVIPSFHALLDRQIELAEFVAEREGYEERGMAMGRIVSGLVRSVEDRAGEC